MKMPKTLYVRVEKMSNGEEDFYPYEDVAAAVDGDGPTIIGVYQLVQTIKRKKVIAEG